MGSFYFFLFQERGTYFHFRLVFPFDLRNHWTTIIVLFRVPPGHFLHLKPLCKRKDMHTRPQNSIFVTLLMLRYRAISTQCNNTTTNTTPYRGGSSFCKKDKFTMSPSSHGTMANKKNSLMPQLPTQASKTRESPNLTSLPGESTNMSPPPFTGI